MPEAGISAAGGEPLGILACAGPLPIEVADAAERQGRAVHIVAIDGFAGPEVTRFSHERVSLGQLGRMLSSFKRAGVNDIVIAGAMQRPNLLRLKIDLGFLRHLPTILSLTRGGDDSVLRRVIRFFEGQGFRVLGAAEVAPALLAPHGVFGRLTPSPQQQQAIDRAASLIAALGPFDIGQAAVASPSGIVAVEGVRGTDAMLGDLGPTGPLAGASQGAVLVKLTKPGQERRIDLPTIGPETVRRARAAGLAGVAVEASGAIVLERSRVIEGADAAGLFVTGIASPSRNFGLSKPDPSPTNEPLQLVGRRAPTPADRRDIAIGRNLISILAAHNAGRAALLAREHVLAITGERPVAPFLARQGRPASWGRQALKSRIGVLMIAPEASDPATELSAELFQAALHSCIAGLVWLGPIPGGERRMEIEAWASEAGVFLMSSADASREGQS